MVRVITVIVAVLYCVTASGQPLRTLNPELGYLVDRSPAGEARFVAAQRRCEELTSPASDGAAERTLTPSDWGLLEDCDDLPPSYYSILGYDCSWYCGGGDDTLSASSTLSSQGGVSYEVGNAHDLSYGTAWVEGAEGYGIGESITYHFPPHTPRITEVNVVNGYVKSERLWRDNSRVKTLLMYVDGEAYAELHLADTREVQSFTVEPLGHGDRADWTSLVEKGWWTIRFEIAEVYEGDRYEDTAITEIYFDGIDVH